jgi:DNA phosphorothioation-dependent restriction protein DptH
MNYYVKSIVGYVSRQMADFAATATGSRKLQIMIPELPGDATMQLAKELENLCFDSKVKLIFKVAEALIQTWNLQEAQQLAPKYKAEGSLTGYRSDISNAEPVVQILVGTAKVTDKASLADFHQCDRTVIWKAQLESTFMPWIEACFTQFNIEYDDKTLTHVNQVLLELRERFDLYQISQLFDEMRFTAQDGREAERELLSMLARFNLPNLRSFRFDQPRRTFRYYVNSAYEFFSYEMFIESHKRTKALYNILKFVELKSGTIPQEVYSPHFADESALFDALSNYVKTNNQVSQLKDCDFVYILDEIIKYRPSSDKPIGFTVKKLSGSPVEVVLHALWFTLGKCESLKDILEIRIEGKVFRHDYMVAEGTTADNNELAKLALARLLGGVDVLCQQHIQITPYEDGQQLNISACLLNENISHVASKTAEPYFEFHVTIVYGDEKTAIFAFAWKLPDNQPYRLADGLISLAHQGYTHAQGQWMLPSFQLAYYQELMAAKDEDEICRVLLHCINECRPGTGVFMNNLFLDVWRKMKDPFARYLEKICTDYNEFIGTAHDRGLHAALNLGGTVPIFQSYREAAEAFTKSDQHVKDSTKLASMLMRAFLVLSDKGNKDPIKWTVAKHESSGIVTVLHPALLEMLQAQVAFLFSAFSTVATNEFGAIRAFKESKWQYYVDMATVQMPLTGLLIDENQTLDVNIVGKDLVHRLGKIALEDAPMTTRLLVRYDGIDDEDVSDAEIFRVTRESQLLFRFLRDFWYMHRQTNDGIAIGIYRNDDIQPILSAIHSYLHYLEEKEVLNPARANKYYVRLILFSESSDETGIVNWLEQWQERWEAAETENKLRCYSYCHLSVSHRIVSAANNYKLFESILTKETDCDIIVLYNFIQSGRFGSRFKEADAFDETNDSLKFPIQEKSLCSSTQPDEASSRAQIISNRQFRLSALHTEIMARLKHENTPQGVEHVVLGYGDYEPWTRVVDAAHTAAEWVICIDANIDEGLIAYTSGNDVRRRELIGFGSGVGTHGESNYTISTQKFYIDDLKNILLESFKRIYKYGTFEDDTMITESLMQSAKSLAGLSLIRALGPSEYVRDFVAYAVMRKLLPNSSSYICDQLFSIDAYRHWFDMTDDDDKTHPDLLWLRVVLTSERKLRIEARLFECKTAEENQEHIDKAIEQIINGLHVLVTAFKPKDSTVSDTRPDQRYWHLQLHRLIASRTKINTAQETDFLSAMEKLAEGDFEITWDAAVFTFWTDSQAEGLTQYGEFDVELDNTILPVPIYAAGYKFLKDLCSGNISPMTEWSDELHLVPKRADALTLPERPTLIEEEAAVEMEDYDKLPEEVGTQPDLPRCVDAPLAVSSTSCNMSSVENEVDATIHSLPPSPLPLKEQPVKDPIIPQKMPDRILLGPATVGQREIYWEFGHPKLHNRFMLIFGAPGMGKTYAIQAILCELGRKGQNSLIVDYTNGFLNNQLQETTKTALKPVQHILKKEKLPISPFKIQSQDLDGTLLCDTPIDVAKRVAATFKTVYDMGDQQFSILTDSIEEGIVKYKDALTLDDVMGVLHSYLDDGVHTKSTVQTTISKLKPFVSEKPFAPEANGIGWKSLFSDTFKKCHVFQLAMIDRISQKILTEFILWDFYAYALSSGDTELNPKVLVLDEVQNLNHNLDAPVGKYLSEGRKFGISLIAATQALGNLEKEQQNRLFYAAHKLFFRPADPEMGQYAEYARQAAGNGDKAEWMQKLSKLQKGECLSIGPALNENTGELEPRVAKIKIASLEDRGFNG